MIGKIGAAQSFKGWFKIANTGTPQNKDDKIARADARELLEICSAKYRVPDCDTVISPQGDILVNIKKYSEVHYEEQANDIIDSFAMAGNPYLKVKKATAEDLKNADITE